MCTSITKRFNNKVDHLHLVTYHEWRPFCDVFGAIEEMNIHLDKSKQERLLVKGESLSSLTSESCQKNTDAH